jgi:hydroxymethylpyrimidine pyrophosphatase-like HAD family hydrolase
MKIKKYISPNLFWLIFIVTIMGMAWFWASSAPSYRLGYCPTMEPYANVLKSAKVSLIALDSSAQVLEKLKDNQIDVALIGRKAYPDEIEPETEEALKIDGYVLVGSSSRLISPEELGEIKVHTYLSPETVRGVLPENKNISYYQDSENIILRGGESVMVAWNNYRGEPIITPMKNSTEKDPRFRSPFFYYKNKSIGAILNNIEF